MPGADDDLMRGRRLLRRRTRSRMLGASAAVAAVAAAAAVVPTVLTSESNAKPTSAASRPATGGASHPATSGASHPATAGIKLVDYTGAQPPGYVVKAIPDHWAIQGSTPFALTIAPPNAAEKDPDSFLGKLVVTQESFDSSGAQGWTSVQAPTSLHWTEQQEGQFGLGVTILSTAHEGKG
jgi:hypothetical protein